MRSLDPALVTFLQGRRGLVVRLLFWIRARNRTTGVVESAGFCSDVEPLAVTIDGEPRTYAAAGGLLRAETVVYEAGPVVRMQVVTLSGVSPEVDQVLRGYDPRLAPAELHRLVVDPATNAVVGPPVRMFRGVVDEAPIRTPEKGGTVAVSLTLASTAREMTRGLALKKSDESQKKRSGDRFRRWADVSGEVDVWWGAVRHVPRTAPPATARPPGGPEERRNGSDR